MPSSSSGAHLRMKPQSSSLFSLLFFLLLPRPSLFYSLKNCTAEFDDERKIVCDKRELNTIPTDIPKTAKYLDLSHNLITRISQTDLTGFTRLETLQLGINYISHTEDCAFSDLSALTELSLGTNKLTNLTDNMFKGLSNVLILGLSRNKIKSISKFAFDPLQNLQELNLWNNFLVQISDIVNIVVHCPSLKLLNLGENQLTSFESDDFPFPLLNITKLDIGANPLRKFSVHSDVFPQLESLSLSEVGPEFEWDVSDKVFLKSLKSLDLWMTRFTFEIYQLIFKSVDSVELLFLRGIDGELLNVGLLDFACQIPSLQRLDLSITPISFLDNTLLQWCSNITDLNLSGSSVSHLTKSSLRMLTQLTRIYLEENLLSRVPQAIRNMSTLTLLSFEANYIKRLPCSAFSNLMSLTELNLNNNEIDELSSCAFTDLQSLKELHIKNNFIFQLDPFFGLSLPSLLVLNANGNNLGWLHKGTFRDLPSLTDLDLTFKQMADIETRAFEGLVSLKNLTLSVPFFLDRFDGLEKLQRLFMHLYVYEGMPELTNYKFNLPSLQELFIRAETQVSFFIIPQYLLQGLDKLQVFSSNKFFCYSSVSDVFSYTPHLIILQIVNCAEFSPLPELFQPIRDLQVMDLSDNNLKSLDFLVKANLTKLEKLILVNNKLTIINETVFEALPSLKYLDLSGNPFVCNCSNAGFIQWAIRNKQVQVVDAFQYRCSSPLSEDGHFLLDFNVQSCWEFPGFLCFISSSALVLFTLLSSFLYHFLRWQLVYGFYLLLAFLYDSKKRRQGCPHIYDAFVSYNVHNEDWVYGELLPELEGQQGWRLCLHHRDFQPGKPIIENITDSIYSSRKTLCVISRRYLQSEWCSREIQMASFHLFDDQKDVLILLFLEEISSNQLSLFYRMRKLVKSRTYLSWTQARSHKGLFWEKVRRALESGNEPGDNHNPLTADI